MIVWDRGTWIPMGDPEEGYRKGSLKFALDGEKLGGGWTLVRLKPKEGERGDNWLLIKERDPFARLRIRCRDSRGAARSVISGRRVEDLDPPAPATAAARRREAVEPRLSRVPGRRRCRRSSGRSWRRRHPGLPEGMEWLHEIKFDGYRTIARRWGRVMLITRSGLDWTGRYGVLAKVFKGLRCEQALIDGEIVVQDEQGIASFAALQDALSTERTHELIFLPSTCRIWTATTLARCRSWSASVPWRDCSIRRSRRARRGSANMWSATGARSTSRRRSSGSRASSRSAPMAPTSSRAAGAGSRSSAGRATTS